MSLVKWFFIFNHVNYARWLSVHIQDLLSLPIACPQLCQEFERELLWSRFQVDSFHKRIMTKPTNKATKLLIISKDQSIS